MLTTTEGSLSGTQYPIVPDIYNQALQSAQSIGVSPEMLQGAVSTVSGGAEVISAGAPAATPSTTATDQTAVPAPTVTVPVVPVAIGAAVGYLVGDSTGLIIGGILGYLFKDKLQGVVNQATASSPAPAAG